MKILSVRIKNLNSLKGEFFIDFEKAPFDTHSLFAIVGATGSGKTTVLDAITLALYGKVFRYGNGANQTPKERVITYGEKEAMAEITFLGNNQMKYASTWHLRYTKKGNINSPERQIADISQNPKKIIATKEREIEPVIEQAIGLKYNQFIRSVILPQGNFAAFLKADQNEKAGILEYITGTEKFSEISKMTFQIHKQEKQKLEALQDKLSYSILLTDEQRTEIVQTIHSLEKSVEQEKTKLHQLELQQNIHIEIKKLTTEIEDIRQSQKVLEEQYEICQKDFNRYEFCTRYQNIVEIFEHIQQLEIQIQEKARQCQTYNHEFQQIKPQQEQYQQKFEQTEQEIQKLEQDIKEREPVWKQAKNIEKIIEKYNAQSKEIERNLIQMHKNLEMVQQNMQHTQQEYYSIEQDEKSTKAWLDTHNHYDSLARNASLIQNYFKQLEKYVEDKKIKENELVRFEKNLHNVQQKISAFLIEQQETEQQKQNLYIRKQDIENKTEQLRENLPETPPDHEYLLNLKKLYQIATQYIKDEQHLRDSHDELQKYTSEIQKIITEHHQIQQNQVELEKIIKKKKKQIELQNDIEELSSYRAKLKRGQPCPLCGATEHPFTQQLSATLSQLQNEMEQYEEEYLNLESQVKLLKTQKEDYNAKITAVRNQQQNIQSRLKEYHDEFASVPYADTFLISQPDSIKNHLTQSQKDYEHYQTLLKDIEQQEEILKETLRQIQQHTERIQQLTVAYSNLIGQQKEYETTLKNIQKNIENLTQETENIHQKLTDLYPQYHYQMTFSDIEQHILNYQQKKQTLQNLSAQRERLHVTIESYQEQIVNIQTNMRIEQQHQENIRQLKQEQDQLLADLMPKYTVHEEEEAYRELLLQTTKRKEILFNQGADIQEKITKIETLRQKTEQEQQELQNKIICTQKQFGEALQNHKITHEYFQNMYLDRTERDKIKPSYDTYSEITENNKKMLTDKNTRKTSLEKQINPSLSFENILADIQEGQQKIDLYSQEIGKNKGLLEQDDKKRKEQSQYYIQIEQQQKTLRRWEDLNHLIGSEKGDKFRRFAQGLTLAKLALLANEHLIHLNPRYRLAKKPNEDLELEVIDAYQADEARDIASLSGGETFLVSLALALALSDLVGLDAGIRSLFIDEGFGTLDPETLDTAITALENLQMSGKTVGVISHVEALKERIHAKIILEKTNEGTSKLNIYPVT